ncbi:endonuclease III [Patescibacteria group bacterium]|nr:endonuclease III [Patescibacteria group bacterium]
MMDRRLASRCLTRLAKQFTGKAMVDFGTPEDTLIATLLSARTRDEQVLRAYPGLRATFPTLQDLAEASPKEIAVPIKTIGLYQNKARAIQGLARLLLEKYNGVVPQTMEELIELPGVGRKTASCVLSYAFRIPAIAVDTHVLRIAHRLTWARGRTPEKIEEELKVLFPKRVWNEVNRVGVAFGRTICLPGKPRCWQCPLRDLCPYQPKTLEPHKR